MPSESREAVIICERFADGVASSEELFTARQLAEVGYRRVNRQISYKKRTIRPPARAASLVLANAGDVWAAAREAVLASIDLLSNPPLELLRCVFGDPSRPTTLDPSCLTAFVVRLAVTVYEERSFERLPELAQALEGAGCTDAVLAHLRSPGPHTRGCHALDAVLGR